MSSIVGGKTSSAGQGGSDPSGLVYDIQGFSVHDGPGIRTTVFLKGCPLRCPWCHSPESQSFKPQVSFKKTDCRGIEGCGHCLEACPKDAIARGETIKQLSANPEEASTQTKQVVHIDKGLCDECGECVRACPPKALYVCGKSYSPEEALKRVLKDRAFYESSGGGVTLSGGEPLCQPDFAVAFLRACKKAGLHTALDTTGYVPWETIERALPFIDLFLYDLKHMDSAAHKQVVGVPNERILENAAALAKAGANFQIRIPVIPRFNDNDENMSATASFVSSFAQDAGTVSVQLLPYHSFGVAKYERLFWNKPIFEAPPMTDEQIRPYLALFEAKGVEATIH